MKRIIALSALLVSTVSFGALPEDVQVTDSVELKEKTVPDVPLTEPEKTEMTMPAQMEPEAGNIFMGCPSPMLEEESVVEPAAPEASAEEPQEEQTAAVEEFK
ncbi:MAG: hypothetical protein Q8Q25_01895, partial [bacterium]|nr:hypothetical protein [bacterium]